VPKAALDAAQHRAAFGRRVRELRVERGLSQEELGARAGIHRNYVGGVERGERNIGLDNIWALADALGVTASALFDERRLDESGHRRRH